MEAGPGDDSGRQYVRGVSSTSCKDIQGRAERGRNYLVEVQVGGEVSPDCGLAGVLLVARFTPVAATVQRSHMAHLQNGLQPLLG